METSQNQQSKSISQSEHAAYKVLEEAKLEFDKAQQKLFAAQAICFEYYKDSDSYTIHQSQRWDNRCEE